MSFVSVSQIATKMTEGDNSATHPASRWVSDDVVTRCFFHSWELEILEVKSCPTVNDKTRRDSSLCLHEE